MQLSEVQTHAVDQIAAVPALVEIGGAIAFSDFTDDDTARLAIEEALRAKGVFIEVGEVEASGDSEKPNHRYSLLDARFDVYIAESPTVEHSLFGMALVSAVATAIQARRDTSAPPIRCTGYGSAKSENGYILRVLSFSTPALL